MIHFHCKNDVSATLLVISTFIRKTAGWIEAQLMDTLKKCVYKTDQQPR